MAAPPARPHIIPRQSTHSFWTRPAAPSNANDWGWTDDIEDDDTWDSGSDQEDGGHQGKKGFSNRIGSGLKVNHNKKDGAIATPSETNTSSTASILTTSQTLGASVVTPIPLANGRPSANARQASSGGRQPSFGSHGSHNIQDHGSTSSGNVSFSFTHLDAPSPSSYPLRGESVLSSSATARQPAMNPPATISGAPSNKPAPGVDARRAAGWTIVSRDEATANRLAMERRQRNESGKGVEEADDGEPVVHLHEDDEAPRAVEGDVDSEMALGDLELEDRATPHKRVGAGSEAITLYVEDIVKDPLFRVRQSAEFRQTAAAALSPAPTSTSTFINPKDSPVNLSRSRSAQAKEKSDRKQESFEDCLLKEDVDIAKLRKLAWSGITPSLRPVAWPLLLGYLPLSSVARTAALTRKRAEYQTLVDVTFSRGKDGLDQQIWHQIEIDVPRTRPGVRLWMTEGTQRSLERILYVWAIRHPTSGYVQGINDLVTPFYQIFLSAYIDSDPEDFDPSFLPPHVLSAVEADSFWCLSRLLDGIVDNYIQAQPGIQRSVKRMRELVGRIDPALAAHLDAQGVEFIQFAFRWMNCLLMREISVRNTIRMWDTYLSEGTDAFSQFHLYVCCAFLVQWSDMLREMDFQSIIMFLQSLPTDNWTEHEIEMLLSQAFVLSNTWANAQSHFS